MAFGQWAKNLTEAKLLFDLPVCPTMIAVRQLARRDRI